MCTREPGTPRRSARGWAALLATVVLLSAPAACGGDAGTSDGTSDAGAPDGAEQDEDSRAGGSRTLVQPLTGEPVEGELPSHPVLAVKIDNTVSSRPQIGLGSADVVTEELVEGGLTRLVAMYHTDVPDLVGPVRSTRASDIGIVRPVDAALVASGGAPVTVRRLEDEGVAVYTEGDPGFTRAADRSIPYNVMVELPELANEIDEVDETDLPAPYLPFGDPVPGGRKATAFDVRFSAGQTTSWRLEDGAYVRVDSAADPGDDFAADNVLALDVRIGDAGYKDPAGNPVPETIYVGGGDAMVFHAGTVVEGTWSKSSLDAPLHLGSRAGPLTVPPGNTWVELVPVDDGDVRIRR